MYTKFPFSMENLPRQKNFGCLSLKFGCIFSALLLILYSVLALAQCIAALGLLAGNEQGTTGAYLIVVTAGFVHAVTMFLTTVMLIGTIREKHQLMKPWVVWTSCQLMASLLLFIFWTTMNMVNHSEASLVVVVIEFLSLLVRFYMLVLVSSYSKELEEEHGQERLKRLMKDDEPKYCAV